MIRVCFMLTLLSYGQVSLAQAQVLRVASLMQAVQQGNVALVAKLITELPIDSRDDQARTAVHHAVIHQQLEVLELLIASAADVSLIDADGKTPYDLHMLKHSSRVAPIAQMLISANARTAEEIEKSLSTDDANSIGGQALAKRNAQMMFKAAADGNREEVEMLLAAGVKPTIKNAAGEFPTHVATRNRHFIITAILLRAIDVNRGDDKSYKPIHWAIIAKDWLMVRELMRAGALFFSRSYSSQSHWGQQDPYDVARLTNQEDLFIKTALAEQSEFMIRGLLEKATKDLDYDLYQKLLDNGVDLQDEKIAGYIAGYVFDTYLHVDKTKQMLKFLFELNINRIALAKHIGSKKVIEHGSLMTLLLDYGVDVNALNSDGSTALVYLMSRGVTSPRPDVVKMLLDRGADPSQKSKDGNIPLLELVNRVVNSNYSKVSDDILTVVTHLLEHGVDVNATYNNKTALGTLNTAISATEKRQQGNQSDMSAVASSNKKIMLQIKELLIANGAEQASVVAQQTD
ncbi:MAG: ankyrin repeat domain-containing protein [Pseudomonadota bacterium]|nr:ankyrin repeat domain-containing protein [Pseudomonadota bacterium]